jgi:membrane dipeptidase
MVQGLQDVTTYPVLFAELLRRGWSEAELMKLAGQNHLRAMREMERVAAELQKTTPPSVTEGPRSP